MVTRVRIEAEGRSTEEVTQALETAHESLVTDAPTSVLNVLFGHLLPTELGGGRPGLVEAQAGEFVIERFAREHDGAIVYRGRMTSHFAPPAKVVKLGKRSEVQPLAGEGEPVLSSS